MVLVVVSSVGGVDSGGQWCSVVLVLVFSSVDAVNINN